MIPTSQSTRLPVSQRRPAGNLGGAGPYLRGVHMREASNEHTNVLNKAQQKGLEGAWAEVGMAPATSSHYPKVRAACLWRLRVFIAPIILVFICSLLMRV